MPSDFPFAANFATAPRGVDFDIKTGLSKEELIAVIGDYDGIAIRSGAKLDKDVIAAANKLQVIARAGIGRARADSHSLRQERLAGAATRLQEDTTASRDSNWSALAKLSHNLGNDHALVTGVEAEGTTRHQNRVTLVNGLPQAGLDDFGDDLDASSTRYAAYAQDEWNVGKQWDFYAGARWEGITTRSTGASYDARNRSSVFPVGLCPLQARRARPRHDPRQPHPQLPQPATAGPDRPADHQQPGAAPGQHARPRRQP